MLEAGTACETKKQGFVEWAAALDKAASKPDGLKTALAMFYDQGWRGKEKVISVFKSKPDGLVYPVLEAGLRDDDNAGLRNAAMEIYVGLGTRSLPSLLALLKDPNEEVRCFSAVMLGNLKERDAVPGLIEALGDPDLNVKHAAAEALGRIKDERAVPPLIEALKSDMWLQFPAAVALGELGDPRAVQPLVGLLEMPGANVPAIQALGKIGDPSAIAPLCLFLEDEEESLREWALEAVAAILSRSASAGCDITLSKKAVGLLLETLKSESLKAKRNAVIVLGKARIHDAVPAITGLIADRDLREEALEAVASIGGEKAFEALISYGRDSDPLVRRAVVAALSGIGTERSMKAIIPFLSDPVEEVRIEGAIGLARFNSDEARQAIAGMLAAVKGAVYEAEKKALDAYASLTAGQATPFAFDPKDILPLRDYISERLGLHYDDERLNVLHHRLSPLAVSAGFSSLSEYYRYLTTRPSNSDDIYRLAAQLTNNETYFFRETGQLKAFIHALMPDLIKTKAGGSKAIRILTAGCSSGEEAYTTAILLEEAGIRAAGCGLEVVGMDIDGHAIEAAKQGRYPARSFRGQLNGLVQKYFVREGDWFIPKEPIRKAVSFRQANILEAAHAADAFDVILCRNVLIYFSDPSVERAANNFYRMLAPGGYLLLGHSESLCRVNTEFVPLRIDGAVVYQKCG